MEHNQNDWEGVHDGSDAGGRASCTTEQGVTAGCRPTCTQGVIWAVCVYYTLQTLKTSDPGRVNGEGEQLVSWLEESQAAGAGRLAGQSKLAAGSAGYIINIESVFLSCFKTFNNILFQIVNFKMIVRWW